MSADAFSQGLLGGYAFADNIFTRRRQLALQEREMARQDKLDTRATTLFDQSQRRDRIAESTEQIQARLQGIIATKGEDPAAWDPATRAEVEDGLAQIDRARYEGTGPPSLYKRPSYEGGALGAAAAAVSPQLAAGMQQRRVASEQMADHATLARPDTPVTTSLGNGAPAPRGIRAVAAQGSPGTAPPATVAPSGVVTQRTGATGSWDAPPPPRVGASGSWGTDARGHSAPTATPPSEIPGTVPAQRRAEATRIWSKVTDPSDPTYKMTRESPGAALPQYARQRDLLPRDVQQKADALMLPAYSASIKQTREEISALTAQMAALPKPTPGVYDNAEQRAARREIPKKLRAAEHQMREFQVALTDMSQKFSVSAAVNAPSGAVAGPELAKAAEAVTMPRVGGTTGPRMKADARLLTQTAAPPDLQAAVSQSPAVRAGRATPTGLPPGIAQPVRIPKDKLDAAGRLFMNGGLTPKEYRQFLEFGTLKDVTTIENLRGIDPYRDRAVFRNGEMVQFVPAKTRPRAVGGITPFQQAKLRVQEAGVRDKALARQSASNMKFVDTLSTPLAKTVSRGAKEKDEGYVGKEEIANEFWGFTQVFAPQLKAKGIDVSDDLGRLSRAQVAEIHEAYTKWKTAATDHEQTSRLTRWMSPPPQQAAAVAGIRGNAAPMTPAEFKDLMARSYSAEDLSTLDEADWQQLYEEELAAAEE